MATVIRLVDDRYAPHRIVNGVLECWVKDPNYHHRVSLNAEGVLHYMKTFGPDATVRLINAPPGMERWEFTMPVSVIAPRCEAALIKPEARGRRGEPLAFIQRVELEVEEVEEEEIPVPHASNEQVFDSLEHAVRVLGLSLNPRAQGPTIQEYAVKNRMDIHFNRNNTVSVIK